MSHDPLDYQKFFQNALRGVARQSLEVVAEGGLPDSHHFYITFLTTHEGVELSATLRELHPEEMTIVLEHQFRDLTVTQDWFSVVLFFSGVAQTIVVPFAALLSFADPSANLQIFFETATEKLSATEPLPEKSDEPTLPKDAADNVVAFRRK